MPADTPWLRIRPDAITYSQCSESVLLREIRAGRLRAAYVGGRRAIRLKREWIDAWLEARVPVEVQTPEPVAQRPHLRVARR
ncbi:MAG: hypothetical protein QM736_15170 [Vicinamibacterales bacterium]